MKTNGVFWLGASSLVLLMLVLFVMMDLAFGYVFLATVLGQLLLIWSVVRILKDDYKTDKTFEDFYEDYPVGRQSEPHQS